MNEQYTRLQASLNVESDRKLIKHFDAVKSEYAALKSDADVIRHILERDRQVSKVYGAAWDWRVIIKTPAWLDKILGAIQAFDGRAIVTIQDKEDEKRQVVFGEGMLDE